MKSQTKAALREIAACKRSDRESLKILRAAEEEFARLKNASDEAGDLLGAAKRAFLTGEPQETTEQMIARSKRAAIAAERELRRLERGRRTRPARKGRRRQIA